MLYWIALIGSGVFAGWLFHKHEWLAAIMVSSIPVALFLKMGELSY